MPPPQGSIINPLEGPGDYTTTTVIHNSSYPSISPLDANLRGKTVFITGASRGLGQAIAIAYAQAGCSQIALGARSDLSETEAAVRKAASDAGREEVKVLSVRLDLADEGSVKDAVAEVARKFEGRIDVVVNNAGILAGRGKIVDGDEGWWDNFLINLRGPYLIARACIPLLLKSELKTIVNVASVGAHCVVPGGMSGYMTSKLAVVRFTEFIAAEYAAEGITAYSIHPGNILTDIVGKGEGMAPEFKAIFTETPDLCADSLVFLTKTKREWLNGRYINCTWDLPELVSEEKRKAIVEGDLLKVRLAV